MDGTLTPEEFSKESHAFLKASDEIGDNWTLVKKGQECGEEYLVYRQKVSMEERLFHFEYHVAYNVSYQVPVLFFKINREDGSIVDVEEAWDIFKKSPGMLNGECTKDTHLDMYKILTQMEHPQLFVPLLALHPCRTTEILAMNPGSKNRILTFISSVGPFVHLNLDSIYGKMFE